MFLNLSKKIAWPFKGFFLKISGDFEERRFDDGQFDALQIWRKVQFSGINLTKNTIWSKNNDEKYNLTKYLKLYRNISSNCAFHHFFFTKLYFSPNCTLGKFLFRQIVQRPFWMSLHYFSVRFMPSLIFNKIFLQARAACN